MENKKVKETKKAKKSTETKENIEVKKVEKPKKYIYIGDSMVSEEINIIKNTILDGLFPFEKALEKDKELKELFIEMEEFAKIKHKLTDPNFRLNRIIKNRRG